MVALNNDAFNPRLNPRVLYDIATTLADEDTDDRFGETVDAFADFAYDWAEILALPEVGATC